MCCSVLRCNAAPRVSHVSAQLRALRESPAIYIYIHIHVNTYIYICIHIEYTGQQHKQTEMQLFGLLGSKSLIGSCAFSHKLICRLQRTEACCITLQHTTTHYNTLQHTATHCNTPQHTATHCNTLVCPNSIQYI